MSRKAILSLAFLLGGGFAIQAQDLWDTSLQVTGMAMKGANAAGLGQSKGYGLGIEGAYPVTRNSLFVLQGGYRAFPTSSSTVSGTEIQKQTDGFFGAVAYRYRLTAGRFDGLFLQGGVRHYSVLTEQYTIVAGGASDGTDLLTTLKGPRISSTQPVIGAGFRFTENLSLEVNLAGFKAVNVKDVSKSGILFELTLGMHL